MIGHKKNTELLYMQWLAHPHHHHPPTTSTLTQIQLIHKNHKLTNKTFFKI